jgi:hypothetical protein
VGALWAWRTLVPVPRLASPFIVALRERGPTAIHDRRPRSGRVSDRETDPEIRLGDHIPNTRTLRQVGVPHRISDCRLQLEILLLLLCSLLSSICACLGFYTRLESGFRPRWSGSASSSDLLFTVPILVLSLDFCSSCLDFRLCAGSSFTHDFPNARVHSPRANSPLSLREQALCLNSYFSLERGDWLNSCPDFVLVRDFRQPRAR